MITREKTTHVEIPNDWIKTKNRKFKVDVPYEKCYGILDLQSLPDFVTTISSHPDRLTLYANYIPVIAGACLIFKSR